MGSVQPGGATADLGRPTAPAGDPALEPVRQPYEPELVLHVFPLRARASGPSHLQHFRQESVATLTTISVSLGARRSLIHLGVTVQGYPENVSATKHRPLIHYLNSPPKGTNRMKAKQSSE
ncbi:hypothetical protein MTP02_06140 [Streptomyces albus]|nr:hypothetical protein MTP02_06140 [Streptomyces albus]